MSMAKGSGGVGEDAQFMRNLVAQESQAWESYLKRSDWGTLRAWRDARSKLQRSIKRQGALYG
jgi:hypothetical protein